MYGRSSGRLPLDAPAFQLPCRTVSGIHCWQRNRRGPPGSSCLQDVLPMQGGHGDHRRRRQRALSPFLFWLANAARAGGVRLPIEVEASQDGRTSVGLPILVFEQLGKCLLVPRLGGDLVFECGQGMRRRGRAETLAGVCLDGLRWRESLLPYLCRGHERQPPAESVPRAKGFCRGIEGVFLRGKVQER